MLESITGKEIANNIRAERNRADITQLEVANKLKITLRTYVNYEDDAKGIKATTLYDLANIFNCNIDDFYLHKKSTKCE